MKIKLKGRILWHWILVAKNGEVVATSETYYSKSNAKRAAWELSKAIKVPISENV
jgi:uncharacterized protein YegP (UPF0339 family)